VKVDASTLTDPAKFQQYAQAQDRLSGVLGRLMVISERYPDLKSNQNFLALQSQLEGTENRIAIARRDYNRAVADYNTSLRTFPQMIWAKVQNAQPMVLFSATSQAQSAPTVNFDTTPPPPPSGTAPTQAPAGAPAPSPAALPPGQTPQ
jgi:LemA protein